MKRVLIESPFAGDVVANLTYARACMHDCLMRNEAPMASHALYTQPGVLRDDILDERARGIAAGLAWGEVADATVAYVDRGITPGMRHGIAAARLAGRPVEYRRLRDGA